MVGPAGAYPVFGVALKTRDEQGDTASDDEVATLEKRIATLQDQLKSLEARLP